MGLKLTGGLTQLSNKVHNRTTNRKLDVKQKGLRMLKETNG